MSELGEADRARGVEQGRHVLMGAGTGCFARGAPGRSGLASRRAEPRWADDNVGRPEKLDRRRILWRVALDRERRKEEEREERKRK